MGLEAVARGLRRLAGTCLVQTLTVRSSRWWRLHNGPLTGRMPATIGDDHSIGGVDEIPLSSHIWDACLTCGGRTQYSHLGSVGSRICVLIGRWAFSEGAVLNDRLRITHRGRSLELDPSEAVTVGRDPACDVVVRDRRVAPLHAEVFHDSSGWVYKPSVSGVGAWDAATAVPGPMRIERPVVLKLGALADGPELHLAPSQLPPVPATSDALDEGAAFEAVVPWLLLLLPALVSGIFGERAPILFAPSLQDGSIIGVASATFVFTAAAALVVGLAGVSGEWGLGAWLGGISLALLISNGVAVVLGLGGLDFFAEYNSVSFLPVQLRLLGSFLLAGVATYGIGGAALGMVAGAISGRRFARWYNRRHA